MHRLLLVVVGVTALLVSSCGNEGPAVSTAAGDAPGVEQTASPLAARTPAGGDPEAIAACDDNPTHVDAQIVAAYTVPVATLRRWRHNPASKPGDPVVEPQFLTGRPESENVTACWLAGDYNPMALRVEGPPHDRTLVLIDADGNATTYLSGDSRTLPADRPVANN